MVNKLKITNDGKIVITNNGNENVIELSNLITYENSILKDNNGNDIFDLSTLVNKSYTYSDLEITEKIDNSILLEKTLDPELYSVLDDGNYFNIDTSITVTEHTDYSKNSIGLSYDANIKYYIYSDILDIKYDGGTEFFYTKPKHAGNGFFSIIGIETNKSPSNLITLPVTVIAVNSNFDQMLLYAGHNIDSSVDTSIGIDTSGGVIRTGMYVDVINKSKSSTIDKIYLDSSLIEVAVGDVFRYDGDKIFTVSSIVGTGIDYSVIPTNSLDIVPTKAIAVISKIKMLPIIQDSSDNSFLGIEKLTISDNGYGIINKNKPNTVSKIYFDKKNTSVNIGDKFITDKNETFTIDNINGVIPEKIFSNFHNYFVLLSNGVIMGYGPNDYSSLGIGSTTTQYAWIEIPLTDIKEISSGKYQTITLKNDGTVWVAGRNNYGQLGTGDTVDINTWTQSPISNARQVLTIDSGSYVVKNDNTLWVAGDNSSNMFGSDTPNTNNGWVETSLTDVKFIEANINNSYALKNDGTVWVAGNNNYGQLGTGDNNSVSTWTQVALSNIVSISSEQNYAIALDIYGDVYVTGYNVYGQLGLGNNGPVNTWTKTNISNVKSISTSYYFSLALTNDGDIMTTGQNYLGGMGWNDNSTYVWGKSNICKTKYVTTSMYGILLIDIYDNINITGLGSVSGGITVPNSDYPYFLKDNVICNLYDYYTNLNTPLDTIPTELYTNYEIDINGFKFNIKTIERVDYSTVITTYDDRYITQSDSVVMTIKEQIQSKISNVSGILTKS